MNVNTSRGADVCSSCEVRGAGRLRERQRHLKARPTRGRAAGCDPAVVRDDDLLHERETETGTGLLRGEERPEDAIARVWIESGAIVVHADMRLILRRIERTFDAHAGCDA